MSILRKFLFLVLTAASGFFGYVLLTILIFQMGFFSDVPFEVENRSFTLGYFGGGMWACLLGSLIGIGYLFSEGSWRLWLLGAPFYVPMLYMIGAVTYFSI